MTDDIAKYEFEMAKLELHDGDILVVKPRQPLTRAQAAWLKSRLEEVIPKNINTEVLISTEPIDLTVLSSEAEMIKRCRNCTHWGEQDNIDKLLAVDVRPCDFDASTLEFNGSAIVICECGGDLDCGPNFGCVHFVRKDIIDG